MKPLQQMVREYRPIGLCAGGLMWLVWLASCLSGHGNLDRTGQVIGTDHTAFHTAATMLDTGQGGHLFDYPDLLIFRAVQDDVTGKPGFLDPYRNPPFYALPYRLTSGLPYLWSYAIWAVVGLLAMAAGLWAVRGRAIAMPMLWALSFYPVFASVSFGQNTLLSFGIFAAVYRCLDLKRGWLAGLLAGFLLYKPQLLLGLGVWWLLGYREHWKSLLGLAIAGVFWVVISLAFLREETLAWVRNLSAIARYDAFEFFNLHNPRGFVDLATGNRPLGNLVGIAGILVGIAWLAWVWQRAGGDHREMFSAAVLATLWGSPHTMIYEWALALLAAVILWDHRPAQRDRLLGLFALSWVVLFVSTPLTKLQLEQMGKAIQISVPIVGYVIWKATPARR